MATSVLPEKDPNALPLAKPAIPKPTIQAPAQPVNRLQLATDSYNTLEKAAQPGYEQSIRDITGQAAGLGQLGSGQWRGALRDESNRHALQLETSRADLVNKATEGSIADASTAYQQALSGAQQGLATELGEGNLAIAKQSANTAETGTLGGLDVAKGQLALAKTGQEASIGQKQEEIDLAKKTADINAAYQAGTLTLAQKDQALRELSNAQANTLAIAGQKQSGEQFAQSLAQNAAQFGASQAQQLAIAKMADAIQKGQLDINTELGRNNLLIQLTQLWGGADKVPPGFLEQVLGKLGINLSGGTPTTTTPTTTPPPTTPYNPFNFPTVPTGPVNP